MHERNLVLENKTLLVVKNDYLFKRIFGENEEIFINFANSILKYPKERKIKSVTFLNNEMNKDSEFDKESRFDVFAQLNDGSYLNLEMQMRNTGEYEKRCLYYWAKLYEQQLTQGMSYRSLVPSICIHILNFNFFKEKEEFITELGILDKKTHKSFSNDFEIIFLEVPKAPKTYYNDLDKWMLFLKGLSKTEVIQMDNSAIHKAQETLEYISQDPIARAKYEARRKYLLDYNTTVETMRIEGREEGRKEGKEEVKHLIAKKMREEGMSLELVIKITGLTADELEKI